jgi:hypothetical protein
MLFDVTDETRSAVISACESYRYRLRRSWADGPPCNFVMLNPSTADALEDDPTIRRCVSFARSWGCGSIDVTNLFALRATDPRNLAVAADPVGPENDDHLIQVARRVRDDGGLIVCAWGTRGDFMGRALAAKRLLKDHGHQLWALSVTKGGHPGHPLYLSAALRPIAFA